MSCKLIRSGDAAAAVQAWVPLRIGTVSGRPAEGRSAPLHADLQRDLAARLKAAFEQGQAAGEAGATQRAIQQAAQKLEPVIARLNQMIQELAGMRRRFRG